MEFWKNANALEKELTFIVLKDFGIKPRTREPNFFSKVYNMKAEDAIMFCQWERCLTLIKAGART